MPWSVTQYPLSSHHLDKLSFCRLLMLPAPTSLWRYKPTGNKALGLTGVASCLTVQLPSCTGPSLRDRCPALPMGSVSRSGSSPDSLLVRLN